MDTNIKCIYVYVFAVCVVQVQVGTSMENRKYFLIIIIINVRDVCVGTQKNMFSMQILCG